jgi:hypothetical protein
MKGDVTLIIIYLAVAIGVVEDEAAADPVVDDNEVDSSESESDEEPRQTECSYFKLVAARAAEEARLAALAVEGDEGLAAVDVVRRSSRTRTPTRAIREMEQQYSLSTQLLHECDKENENETDTARDPFNGNGVEREEGVDLF